MYVRWKSSYIRKDLFATWFTEHFLKYKFLGKVSLLLDCHRTYCMSPLLLQTAAENNITLILLPIHCTRTFQSTYKCFLWPYFKTKPQLVKSYDISRYASSGFDAIKFFRGWWCKWFWVIGYLSFQLQHSSWIFIIHFWYQRKYIFYGNTVLNMAVLCLSSTSITNSSNAISIPV